MHANRDVRAGDNTTECALDDRNYHNGSWCAHASQLTDRPSSRILVPAISCTDISCLRGFHPTHSTAVANAHVDEVLESPRIQALEKACFMSMNALMNESFRSCTSA